MSSTCAGQRLVEGFRAGLSSLERGDVDPEPVWVLKGWRHIQRLIDVLPGRAGRSRKGLPNQRAGIKLGVRKAASGTVFPH